MKVSISELMRLRKEVSHVIQTSNYMFQSCNYGEQFTDDVNITNNSNEKFDDLCLHLTKLLNISLLINNIIEKYNCDNNIGSFVRQKANIEMVLRLVENGIKKSQSVETTSFIIVGNERKSIKNKFVPYSNKKDLKNTVKQLKKEIRELQNKIDIANSKIIDVDIEYDTIEELTSHFNN